MHNLQRECEGMASFVNKVHIINRAINAENTELLYDALEKAKAHVSTSIP